MAKVKKIIYLEEALAEQVTEYRWVERLDSEVEAIRILIRAGLKARGGAAPRG